MNKIKRQILRIGQPFTVDKECTDGYFSKGTTCYFGFFNHVVSDSNNLPNMLCQILVAQRQNTYETKEICLPMFKLDDNKLMHNLERRIYKGDYYTTITQIDNLYNILSNNNSTIVWLILFCKYLKFISREYSVKGHEWNYRNNSKLKLLDSDLQYIKSMPEKVSIINKRFGSIKNAIVYLRNIHVESIGGIITHDLRILEYENMFLHAIKNSDLKNDIKILLDSNIKYKDILMNIKYKMRTNCD